MYTLVMTVVLSASQAPAYYPPSFGGFGGYAGYGGYDGGIVIPYCPPPYCLPPCLPVVICDDSDTARKLKEIKKEVKKVQSQTQKNTEGLKALENKVKDQEQAFDKKLEAQGRHFEKTLENRLREERLRHDLDHLKEKTQALEANEKARALEGRVEDKIRQGLEKVEQQLRHLEEKLRGPKFPPPPPQAGDPEARAMIGALNQKMADLGQLLKRIEGRFHAQEARAKFQGLENKLAALEQEIKDGLKRLEKLQPQTKQKAAVQDAEARALIRALGQKLGAVEGLLKSKLNVVESQVKEMEKDALENLLRKNFEKFQKNLNQIEKRLKKIESQMEKAPAKKGKEKGKKKEKKADLGNRALVVVSLPAGATMYLDGQPTRQGANVRSYLTPELEKHKTYSYTIRVDLTGNGQVMSQTRQVYFRAGSQVRVSFDTGMEPTRIARN